MNLRMISLLILMNQAKSKRASFTSLMLVNLLLGCSSQPICEDIIEVNRQQQECSRLAKVMTNPNYPQQALTARKRFAEECEGIRYQRDNYDTICK